MNVDLEVALVVKRNRNRHLVVSPPPDKFRMRNEANVVIVRDDEEQGKEMKNQVVDLKRNALNGIKEENETQIKTNRDARETLDKNLLDLDR